MYILKSDDDSLVSINNINEVLSVKKYPTELLMGYLVCDGVQGSNRRWWKPHHVYPEEIDPWYLTGGVYLMSVSVARKLYRVALSTPIYDIKDAFITGICAHKASVKKEHSELFSRKHVLKKACLLRRVCAVFGLTIEEMRKHYAVLKVYYRMGAICSQPKPFSTVKWFLHTVFMFTSSPYSYRQTCK